MEMKFYKCAHCGQIIAIVKETGVPVICCGEPMQEIIPGTTDAAAEKHIPVYEVKDGKVFVTVGSVSILCLIIIILSGFPSRQNSAISARL